MYGYGRGFGFRGTSPPGPYVGVGRGGLPRCWYPGSFAAFPYATTPVPYAPGTTREQELTFLNEEAKAIRRRLEDIEARIRELEPKDK
jgi:hypothetical protein